MNSHPHLEQWLDRDLDRIRRKVQDMADLAARALEMSLVALRERNRLVAYYVILRDQHIDERETEVDRLCLEFLARHQPVAQDLRFIFSTIHVNRELERIGDYAESIARQVVVVSALDPQPPHAKFVELGDLALRMLSDAVVSFLRKDAPLARSTMAIEERANSLRSDINAELSMLARESRIPAGSLTPWMTIARRLERVTDQAKNLCEEVLYMCTGEFAKHKSGDVFRILFVDSANNSLSQMAEGIGHALGRKELAFTSAGIAPQQTDPGIVEFMAGKGVDIASQSPKSVEQLPGWQDAQIIVCFDTKTPELLPPHSPKTVAFTWPIKDPLIETSPQAVSAALEEAFASLSSHIRDLAGAVLQNP